MIKSNFTTSIFAPVFMMIIAYLPVVLILDSSLFYRSSECGLSVHAMFTHDDYHMCVRTKTKF